MRNPKEQYNNQKEGGDNKKTPESPTTESATEKRRIIVDIGAGYRSYASFPSTQKFKKNEIYIGIEPQHERIKNLEKSLRNTGEGQPYVVRGRGESLPIKNEQAEEIIIKDVIGDPKVVSWFGGEDELHKAMEKIIQESHRILKRTGRVIVVESYTPVHQAKQLIELFKQNGFELKKTLREDNKEGEQELARFIPKSIPHPSAYLLEFTKKEPR